MVDRFTIEIIRNAAIFASEEMGVVLRNTAYSPNIKDRLDHTCSILTPSGELAAQAEHIPVHLGSMAIGVKNTLDYLKKEGTYLEPGDIIMVNDPYIAGTHLNDITLLKPVYSNEKLVAIVADKAHHVDVGGFVPGSLGGNVSELLQEGVVIPPVKIAERGKLRKDLIKIIAENVRTPEYFKGDLRAQIAALNVGERRILELVGKYGVNILLEAWDEILGYTERYTKNRIRSLGRFGRFEAEDYLELNDRILKLKVLLEIKGSGEITVDFSGTDEQVEAPINAVYGVTVAATSFAIKSVIDPEMPVNHGFYRAVNIFAPLGTIVNPKKPVPVSGGNTETSQRIADVVFRALAKVFPERVPAASCGTMTNVTMGGVTDERRWAFYETIGCGSGGRPSSDGIDGVHTNMTNTLNTPIERIEADYPVIMVEYRLRKDSEGSGTFRGGLGITRAFKLAKGKATITVLAERCKTSPWGLKKGLPGERAKHYVIKKDGSVIELECKESITIEEGDIVYINTPGGGGYGDPCKRKREFILKDLDEERISLERARSKYCFSP